ncbi:TraX family protein [Psychrobacillus sp. FSL H8-0510]|uniref:TraX family protein n=1 Tax=Psychrobacillus sp. FSL H8-0510 TaxID=2921394 RepID=UPI0030F824C9
MSESLIKETGNMVFGSKRQTFDSRVEILKWIAMITMVIDHVGIFFFPEETWMRVIGRIAFPLFMILFVEGAVRTRNPKSHAVRIWLFALLSQVPYTLLFNTYQLNVLFAMILVLMVIRDIRMIGLAVLLLYMFDVDYGWYGVILGLSWYYLRKHKGLAWVIGSALTLIYAWETGWYVQIGAIMGLVLLVLPIKAPMPQMPKSFFFWFYPVHMAIIFVLWMATL